MENFAVLCPELAFKIEYYADAAAYQGSVWIRGSSFSVAVENGVSSVQAMSPKLIASMINSMWYIFFISEFN